MLNQDELFYNCPIEVRMNCSNWQKQCDHCLAYSEEYQTLFYKPIDNKLKHPIALEKKEAFRNKLREQRINNQSTQIVQNSKKGRKVERKLIEKVNRVIDCNSSALSGALFKDGDAKLQINESQYSIEIKSRTKTNLFGPSKKEWDKALVQNVDMFITNSEQYGSFISMPLDIFLQLINRE